MSSTLTELLEHMKPGLLWVTQQGTVRYANSDATRRTGLASGRRLYDERLSRAVGLVIQGEPPVSLQVPGLPPDFGKPAPMIDCRVLKGFSKDDAFILLMPDPANDKTVAYENLMQVLHADLGDPLKLASLELARARNEFTGVKRETLQALFDRCGDVVSLLDRIHDLAALWGNQNLLDNERVELWELIKLAWGTVEPMATHRGIEVAFHSAVPTADLPAVYGSRSWLIKVFEECLQGVVRAARDQARLHVEHRQIGPRAMVVFRDARPFEGARPDALTLPVPRDRNGQAIRRMPSTSARDFIGYELSRHIVALHGGSLRTDDDGGTRSFVIDLPTGAPGRSEPSQLDIQQAQRYAEDLSRLMARARRRRPADPPDPAPKP